MQGSCILLQSNSDGGCAPSVVIALRQAVSVSKMHSRSQLKYASVGVLQVCCACKHRLIDDFASPGKHQGGFRLQQ